MSNSKGVDTKKVSTKKTAKKSNNENKSKRRKLLLGILIPIGALAIGGITAGIVLGVKGCKSKSKAEVEVIGADWDESKSSIALDTDSTIVLVPKSGETIKEIKSLKIGDEIVTDFTFDKSTNTIKIPAKYVKSLQIQIEVTAEPETKEVVDLEITPSKSQWGVGSVIKATNLTIKAKYDDGTLSSALNWGDDYSISKNDTPIADFATTGYTFTNDDLTAGSVLFKIVYLKKTTVFKTFTLTVVEHETTKEEFLNKYKTFYSNFLAASATKIEMGFDDTGIIKGNSTVRAQVTYNTNGKAIGTFNDTASTSIEVAGFSDNEIKTHLEKFSDQTHNFTFAISDTEVSYKVELIADPTKYETVKYNKNTYITEIINTFDQEGYEYKNTNLQNILYADSTYFQWDESDTQLQVSEAGKEEIGALLIPKYFDSKEVTELYYDYAFSDCKMSLIKFANDTAIQTITSQCFTSCDNLVTIYIPDSVTYIAQRAFAGCTSLSNFNINLTTSKLKHIGSYTFYGTKGLKKLDLPKNICKLGDTDNFIGDESAIESVSFADTSKKWVKEGDTKVLDITNPTENARKFKEEGEWHSGISIGVEKKIIFKDLSSNPVFNTNLSEKTISSLSPTLTFTATPKTGETTSGNFTFISNLDYVEIAATDVPSAGQELTIDLKDLFQNVYAGDTHPIIVYQDKKENLKSASIGAYPLSEYFYAQNYIEPNATKFTLYRNDEVLLEKYRFVDIYAQIGSEGEEKKVKDNVDLSTLSKNQALELDIDPVTDELTISIRQHE